MVERAVLVDPAYANRINAAVANGDGERAFELLAGEGWRISLWQTPENREKLSVDAIWFLETIEATPKKFWRS